MPLARIRLRLERRKLAPLEPDAFLRWAYYSRPGTRARGTSPLTLEDVHFELNHGLPEECPGLSITDLRRDYVRLAAKVRRNQRLGLDPWEGI